MNRHRRNHRRQLAAIVVALAIGLAGCGGGSSESGGAASTDATDATDDAERIVPADELEEALLTTDDLGPGWERDDEDADDTDDDLDPDQIDASAECTELIEQFEDDPADEGAEEAKANFERDDGAQFQHQVLSSERADEQVEAISAAVEDCPSIGFDQDGSQGRFEFSEHDVPELGDESVGLKLTITIQDEQFELEFDSYGAVIRRGNTVSTVFLTSGIDDDLEEVPVDPAELDPLAERADEKLAELLGEGT